MKTTITLATAIAVVSAVPNGGIHPDVKISCSKPNVSYCMDSVTLVVCDANAVGTRQFCRDDLAAFPPASGVGACWSSSKDSFDGVCHKACVVYTPAKSTIPADKCNPATVPTGIPTAPGTDTTTATATATVTATTGTGSVPTGTSKGTATETSTETSKPGVSTTAHETTTVPQTTQTTPKLPTTTTGKPGNSTITKTTAHGSTSTTSTAATSRTTVPSAGANANHAVGAMAAAGLLAAFFL